MTPLDTGNASRFFHPTSRRTPRGNRRAIVPSPERRMCFFCWMKVRFHSQMDLYAPALKPASAAFRQLGWFGDLFHPQQARIVLARSLLLARRHGKLNMINGCERNQD